MSETNEDEKVLKAVEQVLSILQPLSYDQRKYVLKNAAETLGVVLATESYKRAQNQIHGETFDSDYSGVDR
jgi:hypothetical protein